MKSCRQPSRPSLATSLARRQPNRSYTRAMAQGKKGLRRIVVAAVVIASIALTLVSSRSLDGEGSSAAASPADFAVPSQGLVLRLHDLPTGYGAAYGSPEFPLPGLGCAAIEPADPQPRLAAFLRRYSPVGCLALPMRSPSVE